MKEKTKISILAIIVFLIAIFLWLRNEEKEAIRKIAQKEKFKQGKPKSCICNKMQRMDNNGQKIPCKC